jgi:F-type H+-transporting ATPase subunit epsilon
MNLEILTPDGKLFSGDVYGVQLPGVTGLFEVLERHAPLVSALKAGRLKILKDRNNHVSFYNIQGGFVEVLNNKVTVLVEGAAEVSA